jgi:hypothetical protein
MTRVHFFAFVWLLAIASRLLSAGTELHPMMQSGSGIDVRVDSWLEVNPPTGFVPVRVTITNRSSSPHTWAIKAQDGFGEAGTIHSSMALTVEPGRTGTATFYAVTKTTDPTAGYYRNLNFMIEGYGVSTGMMGGLRSTSSGGSKATDFIAMSTTLSARCWSQLKSQFSSGSELDGCEVNMAQAPTDWRGWSGIGQLWMTDSDWLGMSEGSKAAMMEWVAMGGSVSIMTVDMSDARLTQMKLPAGTGVERRYGLGVITARPWDGKSPSISAMVSAISTHYSSNKLERVSKYDSAKWSLRKSVGDLSLRHGLIFGFVAVFGILMGPVNLFLLAPASRRHRLFVTVPALSLLGSALLIALMILQDGMGGEGARLTFALLMPEEKKMLLKQEQVSRTGVLLNRSFECSDVTHTQQLNLDDGNPLSRFRNMGRSYDVSALYHSGDWFSSRAIQAQLITATRPTRAAIEFTPGADGAPPTVVSTIEVPLDKLFLLDAAQKVWTAENAATGEKKLLKAATLAEFDTWVKGHTGAAGPVLAGALQDLGHAPGYAFAEAAKGSKIAVETLGAIRWKEDRVIFACPCLKP